MNANGPVLSDQLQHDPPGYNDGAGPIAAPPYTSAIFEETRTPVTKVMDKFTVDLKARKVATTA